MSDATDFSWQNAKAAHAVLLCDMERGTVSWKETSKIDRIRRAHAQKHLQNSKPWAKNSDTSASKKPWFLANHSRLVRVPSTRIMRVMANGKNIYVQIVWKKVRSCHILKKIVIG